MSALLHRATITRFFPALSLIRRQAFYRRKSTCGYGRSSCK